VKIFELRQKYKHFGFDGEEIICHTLGIDKAHLLLSGNDEISPENLEKTEKRLTQLSEGEPLQYILNSAFFYTREFFVDSRVLIPRFDTECVVEYAVKELKGGGVFADICTGSGCIGLTLLCECENTKGVLLDISKDALDVAKINGERLGVCERFKALEFDVMSDACWDTLGKFDLIVSNPPYIPTEDIKALSKQVLKEPRIALDGGFDGMDFYRKIIERSRDHFTRGVNIIFEIGYDEGEKMKTLADTLGLNCKIKCDINGLDRVALLKE
jgi:release factor glutamine methyltransferase